MRLSFARIPSDRLARPSRTSAALIALAFAILAVGQLNKANAECGDYVIAVGAQGVDDVLRNSLADEPSNSSHSIPIGPCHGPQCQQRSPSPPLPAPPPPTKIVDQWALVALLSNAYDTSNQRFSSDLPLAIPANHLARVERPPRA